MDSLSFSPSVRRFPKYFQLLAAFAGHAYVQPAAALRNDYRQGQRPGWMVMKLESRKSTRFQLEVPILCKWRNNDAPAEFDGVTRDISVDGIFVVSPECPPVGSSVSFDATFPPLQSAAPPLRMHGEGRVLRVQHDESVEGRGFAAAAGFTLRDSEDDSFSNGR